jgi:hypothetical protein
VWCACCGRRSINAHTYFASQTKVEDLPLYDNLSRGEIMRDYGRRRESQVCGARVMVDVEWQPLRIESQLEPRWKIVPSSHRLRYVCWGGIRCGDRSLCGLAWMWDMLRMAPVACVLEKRGFVILQFVMRRGGR